MAVAFTGHLLFGFPKIISTRGHCQNTQTTQCGSTMLVNFILPSVIFGMDNLVVFATAKLKNGNIENYLW